MKKIIISLLVVVIAVGAFFGYQQIQKNRAQANSNWQTAIIQRGDLTAIVGATGTVRSNQNTLVSWQTSGRIGKISVKLDDSIREGQILASLDENSLSQSVILAKADLVTAERNLANLRNSALAKSQAELTLVQAEKALQDAKDKRDSKNFKRAEQATIDTARANLVLAQKAVDDAEEIFNQFVNRSEDDILRAQALSQLSNARLARDRAQASLNYLLELPDPQEIAEADARVALAQAQNDDAKREVERLQNGVDPKDIEAAEARVAAIKLLLNQVNLTAPFDGTITNILSKEADQVNPGSVSFRIDDLSHLLVDVLIAEVDINQVRVGQPADLTFDAIPGKSYKGEVYEVGRVGTTTQGVVNFMVTVEILDADQNVKPGMTVGVNIIVNQINDVVIAPNRGIRLLDGNRVIYVLKNNVPTPVRVQIGSTSDTFSEIFSDEVNVGDTIVLNPPVQFGPGGPGFMGGR